jgi:hypothetical protein
MDFSESTRAIYYLSLGYKMKHLSKIFAVILFILVVSASLYYAGVFNFNPNLQSVNTESLISVSNVQIQPQGPSGTSLSGSCWVVALTTDINDQYGLLKFSDYNQSAQQAQLDGQSYVPKSDVQIKIIPKRPYWDRALDAKAWTVYPAVSSGGVTVPELDVSVKLWGSGYWTAHTPFEIQVIKNGQVVADQTVDTAGSPQTISLQSSFDSTEWIAIRNLGQLGTGYSAPQLGDILMLATNWIFQDTPTARNAIQFTSGTGYATYWFGPWIGGRPDGNYGFARFPGWAYGSLLGGRIPLAADEFTDAVAGQKDSQGNAYYMNGYGLVHYLTQKLGLTTISDSQMNVCQQSWAVTNDGHLRINLPYGAMSSLCTLYVSTSLADAVVWQPPTSDIRITDTQWQASGDIGDRDVLLITTKQFGNTASTATVTVADQNGNHLSVNPPSYSVTLAPGQSHTDQVEILNTGATMKESGSLHVVVTNVLGQVTSTKDVGYTLEPKGVGATSLTVYAVDKVTDAKVSGIQIAISYGTVHLLGTTGTDGAYTQSLAGAQGTVDLTSVENMQYYSASTTKDISVGLNTAFLYLQPKNAPAIQDWTWLLIAIAVAAAIGIPAVAVAYEVHKKKKRR